MSNARTLASTINSSSQIVVPSGGINFGTSTDGTGTVAGGVLDDYEEGSWTPEFILTNLTASSQSGSGTYIRIGNQVFVQGYASISGADLSGTGGTSTLSIGDLPFSSANIGTQFAGRPTAVGRIETYYGGNNSTDFNEIYFYISGTSTTINLGVNKHPQNPDTTDFLYNMTEKSLNSMVGQSGIIEVRFQLTYQAA